MRIEIRDGTVHVTITRWDTWKANILHWLHICGGLCPLCYHDACEHLNHQRRLDDVNARIYDEINGEKS